MRADLLAGLRAATDTMVADLESLVMGETPSEDLDAVGRGCRGVADLMETRLGARPETFQVDGRPHLRLRTGSDPRVLLLCHLDTVWPLGTTARWPFSSDGTTATGPGVFDMKAGLVQGLHALAAGIDLDRVSMLITTDEEIGSPTSRPLVEEMAKDAEAVLVLEPSAAAAVKTARKGVSMYTLEVGGRASHAGLDPAVGVNALLELADQLPVVAGMADLDRGTTVSPTRATAGSARNTIPASARADIDVRAWSGAEQLRVDDRLRALRPGRPGATVTLHGGVNRPPLEREASQALYEMACRCADELGLGALEGAAVGGGSDGNFAGALGVPTLDGLGAVGDHAHAEGEYVELAAMAERAAVVHAMITRILTGSPVPSTMEKDR